MNVHRDFEEIGLKYDTDKISHHGYHRTYPYFLEPMRNESFSMLEIGLSRQGSLGLWQEYFPHAVIFGIDISEEPPRDGVTIFKADQSDKDDLLRICAQIPGELSLIIDDGSHVPAHQLTALHVLWGKLAEGGIYIIEDIETSYWKNGEVYGYRVSAGKDSPHSLINQFKQVADSINSEFFNPLQNKNKQLVETEISSTIESLTFCQNAIILVKKRSAWQAYYNRDYRFKDRADPKWK